MRGARDLGNADVRAKGTGAASQLADFSQVNRAMRDRVKEDGLRGGALLIGTAQGGVLERKMFRKFSRTHRDPDRVGEQVADRRRR